MSEKKILFLVDFYFPTSSANAVCVKHLQESLLLDGIKSDILCCGERNGFIIKNEFGNVYSVKSHLNLTRDYKKNPITFLERIHNGIIWPLKSLSLVKRFRKVLKTLEKDNSYLGIVCSLRPIEAALACVGRNFILYELDSITNNSDNLFGIKRFLKYRSSNIERKLYRNAGLIIHMRSHKEYYEAKKYKQFAEKSVFADIPGLVLAKKDVSKAKRSRILICYTGALNSKIRSPKYALSLFKKASEEVDLRIDFYSRGDCSFLINSSEYGNIASNKGYVPSEKVPEILASADFLLNIGNCFSGKVTSLPSKTIEYISTGRPIIHIDGGANDTAKAYIERYGNSLIVSQEDPFELNVRKIIAFVKANFGRIEEREKIELEFAENLPSYTTNIIINHLQNQMREGS